MLLILLLAGVCFSANADVVTFQNGDRITGSIVKKDAKALTVKSDNFGVISVPWERVASVKTDAPLTVVLQDGKTVEGTVATADGRLEVATKDERIAVAPADVAALRNADEQRSYEKSLERSWLRHWNANGGIGLAGTQGNAKTQTYTTNFDAVRATSTDKTTLYFKVIKASALVNGEKAGTAEAVRGGITYNHNIRSRLFVNTFNDYEYDRFQNLDLRFVIGGGLGYAIVKSERSRLDVVGGGAFNHESFSTPLTRSSGEAYWGDDYAYKITNATSLTQSFRLFPLLTGGSDFRMNADISVTTKITKWLNWNLSLSDRYLSDPAPGRKTNDWIYTTGIGFTFAR